MMLGDHGTEVFRVDPPTGPRWDTPANAVWNRGKRSIALDLKTPQGVTTAAALIATADVVVENFRPGVMDALGLGADAMREANPALIFCRSEEHTSELQSLMRISYAVFCLKKKK